jgi:hypothetical protein
MSAGLLRGKDQQESKISGSVRRDDVGFARIRNASYFVTLDLIRL